MTSISRILCPVDFSAASQAALDYAGRLAAEVGAELLMLHAFERPATLDPAGQTRPADASLPAQLDALECDGAPQITRLLHAGPAGEVACWMAEHRQCDLIIMGTHGRTGLRHLLLGSVAEYVLRHARCPVLTIRERPAQEPPLKEPSVLPRPAPRMM